MSRRSAPRCPSRRSPCRGRGSRARPPPRFPRRPRTAAPRRAVRRRSPRSRRRGPARPTSCDQNSTSAPRAAASRGRRRSRRCPRAPPRRAPVPRLSWELLPDGPGRGLRVELVRVVEHGGLRGAGRLPVVMDGDRVQELRPNRGIERGGSLLDQAQAEMDVTEQAPLLRRAKRRPAAELEGAPDVVQQRGGGEEVAAQARMELGRLATERRDPDGVLEQPARVAVVTVRSRGGKRPKRRADAVVAENPARPPPRARRGRSRRRGSRGSRRAPPGRGAWSASARPDRCPARPRPCAPAPGACRRTAPRVRARGRRRPRRSGRRAARRRPRCGPRSSRSRRRARGRGRARRSSCAGAPCGRRRTRPRRCDPPRARQCWSRRQSRRARWAGTLGPWPMFPRSARFATRTPRPR